MGRVPQPVPSRRARPIYKCKKYWPTIRIPYR
jgi:hypothetical protein